MSIKEKLQKARDIARGLTEDIQTVKKATRPGALEEEIRIGEEMKKAGQLSLKQRLLLKGLKSLKKHRKTRKPKYRKNKRR